MWNNKDVGVRVAHSKYSHRAAFAMCGEKPVLMGGNYCDVLEPGTGAFVSRQSK